MPEVHLPRLGEDEDVENAADAETSEPAVEKTTPRNVRGRSLARVALEVVLISTGVFLGLAGEQWRENVRHHELAKLSLERFRLEMGANRKAVADVKDYHVAIKKALDAYFAADPKKRQAMNENTKLSGIRPALFERTAWDGALATQAVAYIDPQLIYSLSRIYNVQQEYAELTQGILHAMYLRPPGENLDAFLRSLQLYYSDAVGMEPALLSMYDEIIPEIDAALRE